MDGTVYQIWMPPGYEPDPFVKLLWDEMMELLNLRFDVELCEYVSLEDPNGPHADISPCNWKKR